MRTVLDTNALVAGLLSPFGSPGEIVRLASSGTVTLCLDARILGEHGEVLARPRFGFGVETVAALLDYLNVASETVAAEPLPVRSPDRDDEPFLEVALACGAACLVTGNQAHTRSMLVLATLSRRRSSWTARDQVGQRETHEVALAPSLARSWVGRSRSP